MSARSSTVGPSPLASTPTTPVPPTPVVDLVAEVAQPLRDDAGGPVLGERELGVRVQVAVDRGQVSQVNGTGHGSPPPTLQSQRMSRDGLPHAKATHPGSPSATSRRALVARHGDGAGGEAADLGEFELAGRGAREGGEQQDDARGPCSRPGGGGPRPSAPARSASASAVATTATTRSPQVSSGTPTTDASVTPGWASRTSSTSCGCTFSPPVLITPGAAAEEPDRAVGVHRRQVAGHRVADSADGAERRRWSSPRPCSSPRGSGRRRRACRPAPLPGTTSAPSAVSTRVAAAGKNRDGRSADRRGDRERERAALA